MILQETPEPLFNALYRLTQSSRSRYGGPYEIPCVWDGRGTVGYTDLIARLRHITQFCALDNRVLYIEAQTAWHNTEPAHRKVREKNYALLTNVENECAHLTALSRMSVVYCNFDDPRMSNYFPLYPLDATRREGNEVSLSKRNL